MTLGVHFAITDEQRKALENAASDEDRIDYIKEVIEEEWDEEYTVESDKAWDTIHRSLGEMPPGIEWLYPVREELGPFALPDNYGEYPLKICILGGKKLVEEDGNYFIRLIEPHEISDLVPALNEIDIVELSKRYFKHCKDVWPEFGQEDFEYTWEYFVAVREFFQKMEGNGRSVIFTASGV